MPDHAAHLQAILDAATETAKANPTAANITAVEKARKAVDDYARVLACDGAGERFKTQTQALDYLQRRYQIEKSKLSKDVQTGRLIRIDGFFTAAVLDNYAALCELPLKSSVLAPPINDDVARLKRVIADKEEFKLKQLRGEMLDAAEEEARDAAVLLGIRRHLEVAVPDRVAMIISSISSVLTDEQRGVLATRMPEIIQQDLEVIADIFDNLAKRGGVEV